MKDPRLPLVRLLLASFLVTGALLFCLVPISYGRDAPRHVHGVTERLGGRESGEALRHTGDGVEEDLLTHLWRPAP